MTKPITSGTVISTEDDFQLTTEDGRLLIIEAVVYVVDQKWAYTTCGTFTDTEAYELLDYGGFIR